uniref:hypothetical protein n=1 Tax=uncultured Chryseobacterium sp. TaxID=259322 RepID=UPI0025D544AD
GGGSYATFGQTPAYAAAMNAWRNGQSFNLINRGGYLNWNTLDTANSDGMLGDGSIGGMTAHSYKLQNAEPTDYSGTIMTAGLVTSGVLLADDVTVVGVADDVAIPPILAIAAVAAIAAKATYEIQKIMDRQKGPQGVQYSLRATTSGLYPVYSSGSVLPTGTKFLNAGDVWKYGETINPENRYTDDYLRSMNLIQYNEFSGSQMQIKLVEKSKIYGYFLIHGELPAGNKIFR